MKRMLFNATHQEELRVAIVDGQKMDEGLHFSRELSEATAPIFA